MGMKLGTIDGVTWTLCELETSKFKEVVKSVMLPYLLSPAGCEVLVNMNSWKALPNNLKQTVESIAREYAPTTGADITNEDGKAVAAAKAFGVKFVTISNADQKRLREAARSESWRKLAEKSELSKKLVQRMEDYLKKKGVGM